MPAGENSFRSTISPLELVYEGLVRTSREPSARLAFLEFRRECRSTPALRKQADDHSREWEARYSRFERTSVRDAPVGSTPAIVGRIFRAADGPARTAIDRAVGGPRRSIRLIKPEQARDEQFLICRSARRSSALISRSNLCGNSSAVRVPSLA